MARWLPSLLKLTTSGYTINRGFRAWIPRLINGLPTQLRYVLPSKVITRSKITTVSPIYGMGTLDTE